MALVKIITGVFNSGKTTEAIRLVERAAGSGLSVGGFVSEAEYVNGRKNTYYIRDIATCRRVRAVSAEKPADGRWRQWDFSRFWFSDEAFGFASRLLDDIRECKNGTPADVVFIDEMGPLELSGGGFFPAVNRLLQEYDGIVYIIIRESLVKELASKLGIDLETAEIIRPEIKPSN